MKEEKPIPDDYYLKYPPFMKDEQTQGDAKEEPMEDIARRKRDTMAKSILSDGDEEYKINCICTLLESQSELQSLRDQLAAKEKELVRAGQDYKTFFNNKNIELQQRDETIKELKETLYTVHVIAEYYHNRSVTYTEHPFKNWNSMLDKARKLIDTLHP